MVHSTLYSKCLFILGLGSLVTAGPLDRRDLLGINSPFSIANGIIVLSGHPDTAFLSMVGKREPDAAPLDFFGLSFPNLFPNSGVQGSVVTTSSASSPTTTSSSAAKPTGLDAIKGWTMHNTARAARGIGSLAWDSSLEAQALAYAKVLANLGTLVHSSITTRPGQGENLAYVSSTNTYTNPIKNPIEIGTSGWLAEALNYNNEVIPTGNFANYGHYTQVMWNATTKVGIAAASNWAGAWYIVARYSAPGNFAGQKPYQ